MIVATSASDAQSWDSAAFLAECQRPRALVFDWDNTLVDTWQVIHFALKHTFEAMGREPWTPQETRERVRQSAREAFPRLFGDRAEEASEIFYRTFESTHLDQLTPLTGAASLLADLAASRRYLAVVSNKRGDLLRREADHLGWSRYFAALVGANDAPEDKPARPAFDLALGDSGIAPASDVWYVGDTDIDLLFAKEVGCVGVLVRAEPPQPGEFDGCLPDLYLADCASLSLALRDID